MIRKLKNKDLKMALDYHEGKDFPFPSPIVSGYAIINGSEPPVGFGFLIPQVELSLIIDAKRSKKDKARAIIESAPAARYLASKLGYPSLYVSTNDKEYQKILEKHFGLINIGEILRGDISGE